jgi:hypothetical protein
MPKVFNWQINREMEYPYEASLPQRQFSAASAMSLSSI